jgi:hypothetical protein
MPNERNLRPIKKGELSKEEAKKRGSIGGKKSVEVRREKKLLREELILLLSQGKTQEKMSLALIEEAIKGNVKAFEVIRDTIGEKPINKQEVSGVSIPSVIINRESVLVESNN